MGTRRDDITSSQRTQIAIEVLSPHPLWGTVSKLAKKYEVSRQTVYEIAATGTRVLVTRLKPMPHGPQPTEKVVWVDRNWKQAPLIMQPDTLLRWLGHLNQ